MRYRGVHDDISRGPAPDARVPEEADPHPRRYKLNVYSPYLEQTLA
jgi:hypothetical protein